MPEPTVNPTTEEKNVQTEQKEETKPEPQKEEDLITRVSRLKGETQAKQEIDDKFNINELDSQIEKIQDPTLKETMVGLKKSLLRGENLKYQEIANLRKQYEQELSKSSQWNPERVQGLLQDPNFINAAQSILNQQQTNNDSMLTEQERKLLEENNRQVRSLVEQNQQLVRKQQETELKAKYPDYDSVAVDKFVQDFYSGKRQATLEDAWVLINWKNMIQRAYDLALQDKQIQNQEKVNAMTFPSSGNMVSPSTLERQKGESVQDFMRRSYVEHIKKK